MMYFFKCNIDYSIFQKRNFFGLYYGIQLSHIMLSLLKGVIELLSH